MSQGGATSNPYSGFSQTGYMGSSMPSLGNAYASPSSSSGKPGGMGGQTMPMQGQLGGFGGQQGYGQQQGQFLQNLAPQGQQGYGPPMQGLTPAQGQQGYNQGWQGGWGGPPPWMRGGWGGPPPWAQQGGLGSLAQNQAPPTTQTTSPNTGSPVATSVASNNLPAYL
jgi:hypothetical protein